MYIIFLCFCVFYSSSDSSSGVASGRGPGMSAGLCCLLVIRLVTWRSGRVGARDVRKRSTRPPWSLDSGEHSVHTDNLLSTLLLPLCAPSPLRQAPCTSLHPTHPYTSLHIAPTPTHPLHITTPFTSHAACARACQRFLPCARCLRPWDVCKGSTTSVRQGRTQYI